MFVAMEIANKENEDISFKNRISNDIKIKKVRIKNSTPFYVLTVNNIKRIPWRKIEKALGRLDDKVLLPHEVNLGENTSVKCISFTNELSAVALLNTARLIAHHSEIPPTKMKISIVDRDGIYINFIERLVDCASSIKIVTNNYLKYENVVNNIFNYWGASILITDDVSQVKNSNIIISPFEDVKVTKALVLTLDGCMSYNDTTAKATRLKLPEKYKEYLPNGIDEHDFASILYDEYKFKSLGEMSLDKMNVNGNELGLYELSKLVVSQYSFT